MRVFIIITVAIFGLSQMAFAQQDDKFDEISIVVQKYLDGTSQGKPKLVKEAFLPSLEIQWLGNNGELLRRKGPDYISRIEEGKVVPRYGRIISIDSTDRSAMAKVEIEWNNRLYTDYMLILKVEGDWRITNKIATWVELE